MNPVSSAPTVYTGRATNWPVLVATVVFLVPLVSLSRAAGDDWRGFVLPVTVAVVGVLLEVVTASSVRASSGPRGVTVHWGVLGWPRMHYPPAEIVEARVVHVPWWSVSFGFWWTPWRTTCTTRSGPALRLVLSSNRIVTVTVPDPAAAVAALHGDRADPASRVRTP